MKNNYAYLLILIPVACAVLALSGLGGGFLCYSLLHGSLNKTVFGAVLSVYIAFFVLALYPNINEPVLLCCVFAYLVISCLSLAAATGMQVVAWTKSALS
jgi:hypothetical protein